jgi:hypothetical protein
MFKVLNPYLKKMVDIAVLYWRQYPRIVTHIGEHRIGTFSFLDQGDKGTPYLSFNSYFSPEFPYEKRVKIGMVSPDSA